MAEESEEGAPQALDIESLIRFHHETWTKLWELKHSYLCCPALEEQPRDETEVGLLTYNLQDGLII
eukprot:2884504-Amphidinium_carterae.1